MKHVLGKEFLREILRNKGRFLSIFFIVMLGAAFFAGIRSTAGDMKGTADRYYDDTDLMDIRVLSTLGLTDEDLQDIAALEGVEQVQGGYTKDVLLASETNEVAVKLIADNKEVNRLLLEEGREIERPDECIVDARFMKNRKYSIGDTLILHSGTEDPLEDSLKETAFTIVGYGNLPYYMDLTRGVGSIGDGSLSGYLVVSPEVFDLDVYTEIYVRTAGTKELNSYSDTYSDQVGLVVDKIKELENTCAQRRYDSLYSEAEEKLADGKKEVADAKQELADAREELDDGKKKLDDGKKELADGKKELDDAAAELSDGKKELDDAAAELADGKKELTDAENTLAAGKQELDTAAAQLADGKVQLDAGSRELEAAEAELASGEAQAAAGRKELDAGAAQLAESKGTLDAAEEQLAASEAELEEGKKQLEENRSQLEAGKAELEKQEGILEQMKAVLPPDDPTLLQMEQILAQQRGILEAGEGQLAEAELQYEAGLQAYEQGLAEYQAGKAAYEEARARLEQGELEWAEGQKILEAGRKELEAGKAVLESRRQEYEQGKAAYEQGLQEYTAGLGDYEEGRQAYEDGKAEYEKGLKKYEDGKKEYEDGLKEWKDGQKEYEENLKKWEDGQKEYEDAEEEALPKIADAEQEIADAEEKLAELKVPEWYVLDRDKIQSCVSYGSDADRMDSLGNVFPVLFFLVAALVSLTAMTRMVEEQRQQIGTMKALGYGGSAIAFKYFGYAMLATVTGGVIGVVIGEKLLPWVIMSAYGMLYTGLPYLDTPLNLVQGTLAVVLSALCTGGATLAACMRKLVDSPAKLMRPEAPMGGSRILLERITFLWKRLSFTRKSTMRNLFRYKKRFIMTIIGIGGCMGLMLVGYGIRDSITVVAQNQFVEIFMQDASVSVDTDADPADLEQLQKQIAGWEGVTDQMQVSLTSVTLNAGGADRTASLYVPKNVEEVQKYVRFRNRVTKHPYSYPVHGVALSEKTANMLDVKVGDTIQIQKGEKAPFIEMPVETIVENYVQHYAFISPDFYEELFGESVEYNYIYVKYDDFSKEQEEEFGKAILKEEACIGFSTTAALEKQITDMLQTLDKVMWVLIGAAALLAFVVLYNLNSINMTERKRELATLKVLGFYDPEVAMYVYRENILLTILGIIAGCFIGKVLHLFTILTVEVDLMMFGRVISVKSYLTCAILTVLFSVAVNLIMYMHFKKIDMIESLKSVE